MKRILFLSVCTSLLLFTACSTNSTKPEDLKDIKCQQDGVEAPAWTCIPSADGYMAALGIAPTSKLGESFVRNNALADARKNLAHKMETEVKSKVENFVRETGVGDAAVADSVSTQVSKQLAHQTIKNSQQLSYWKSPANTVYVLVGVDENQVNQNVKENIVKSSHNNEDALWQQFQNKQSLESLEKEFPTSN